MKRLIRFWRIANKVPYTIEKIPVKKNKLCNFIKTDEIVQIHRINNINIDNLGIIEKSIVEAKGEPW